jgi:hypothetical protein
MDYFSHFLIYQHLSRAFSIKIATANHKIGQKRKTKDKILEFSVVWMVMHKLETFLTWVHLMHPKTL